MKILIAGTPGVGKTTLSQRISEATGIEHIDVTDFVKKHKIYESYDQSLDTLVFDEETVIRTLNAYVSNKESFIIDTHSPVVASEIDFTYIFHVVCSNRVIAERLEKRGYSEHKIQNNIESEIFNIISEEIDEFFDIEAFKVNGCDESNDDTDYTFDEVIDLIKDSKI